MEQKELQRKLEQLTRAVARLEQEIRDLKQSTNTSHKE